MPKIDINHVAEVVKHHDVDPKTVRAIMENLQALLESEAAEEKPPAIKKQFCILISDPDARMPQNADFAGWVIQIPEGESAATVTDRLKRSAEYYNTTRKGRLNPCRTIGEAIEYIPAGVFKENDVWVKTKSPVLMLKTDNEIPNPNQGKLFGSGREDAA